MKRFSILAGLALLSSGQQLSAEPLRTIATTPGGSVYLLDIASIRDLRDASGPYREVRIRTDNRRSSLRGPTDQLSSDSLFRARCASGSYRIVWTDITQRNGRKRLGDRSAPARPYTQSRPASLEADMVRAICRA